MSELADRTPPPVPGARALRAGSPDRGGQHTSVPTAAVFTTAGPSRVRHAKWYLGMTCDLLVRPGSKLIVALEA